MSPLGVSVAHHVHTFGFGGAERVAASLFRRAQERGQPVTLHAPLGGEAERGLRREVGDALEGVQVSRADRPNRLAALKFALYGRKTGSEVIHAHLPSPDRLGAALIARRGRPAAFTFHLLGRWLRSVGPDVIFGRHTPHRMMLRAAARASPLRLIALTEVDAERLRAAFAGVQVSVVHNVAPEGEAGPAIALPFGKGLRLLCIGRLDPQKGFDRLIDALAEEPARSAPWSLCIVGEGQARSALAERVKARALEDRVRLVGAHPGTRVLGGADLLIAPSRAEGMSLVLLEALEAGVPIVASAIPVHRELFADGPAALLPESQAAWSEALAVLISQPGRVAELAAAQAAIAPRFGRDSQDSAYAEVYRELSA